MQPLLARGILGFGLSGRSGWVSVLGRRRSRPTSEFQALLRAQSVAAATQRGSQRTQPLLAEVLSLGGRQPGCAGRGGPTPALSAAAKDDSPGRPDAVKRSRNCLG